MKPDFALFLSFEGISLLYLAADGWRHVGDVTLDTEDLTADLADLRDRAKTLCAGDIACKIMIPNDQIRYLTIETGTFEGETRREMARAALADATPYDVADLAFDLSFDGDRTHIAAVARDTLEEAEEFARTHGFAPVLFSAVPEDGRFPHEPFFGQTSTGSGDADLSPDLEPTRSIGPATLPEVIDEDTGDTSEISAIEDSVPPVTAGFASRRSKPADNAPPLAGATRDSPPADAPDTAPTTDASIDTVAVPTVTDIADPAEPSTAKPSDIVPPPPSLATRFFSRRKGRSQKTEPTPPAPKPVVPAPSPLEFETDSETERMTIFGARDKAPTVGKPRHLGVILTGGLLLVLAAVAVWSALFSDPQVTQDAPVEIEPQQQAELPVARAPDVLSTAPDLQEAPADTAEDTTALDPAEDTETPADPALAEDTAADPDTPNAATLDAEAMHALTGIWHRAPDLPDTPPTATLDDLYIVSIDNPDLSQDAVAIPGVTSFETDDVLASVTSPAAAGTEFAFNDSGLVEPSESGTLTPDGVLVFLGRPPVVPPPTPTRFESEPEAEIEEQRDRLALLRPNPRPDNLAELNERNRLGGLTRSELAGLRPKLRPETVKREAEEDETPTAQAVVVSRTPELRPRNFQRKVKTAQARAAGPSEQVATATVAPRTVTPRIPSSASVARRATMDNAINLRRINLIGVYGTPSNRRALVRLPSGRYKKVKVGDNVDGGRVLAIGDSELRYQKGGRNLTLKIPSG